MALAEATIRRQFSAQKSALTKAKNSGDPAQVIKVTKQAVAQWENWPYGWPDNWHNWNIALEDAYDAHRQQFISGKRSDKPVANDYDIDAIRRTI